jgi:hypothetical protein
MIHSKNNWRIAFDGFYGLSQRMSDTWCRCLQGRDGSSSHTIYFYHIVGYGSRNWAKN